MKSPQCFICGDENPKGFHIPFSQREDGIFAEYICEREHEGWPGIQHGGVTSALLDEASGSVTHFLEVPTVTASLNITYHAPIYVGEHLTVRAKAKRITRRLIDVEASIVNREGELKASSAAKMRVLSEDHLRKLGIPVTSGTVSGGRTD